MTVLKRPMLNCHLGRKALVTLSKPPMVGSNLGGLRRRYLLKTGGRSQKVEKSPLESLFTTRTLSGSDSVPSLVSLQEEEQFGYVDGMEMAGLKAPKSRTGYQVIRMDNSGRCFSTYVKRKDMLRAYELVPRDIRRIDPTLDKAHSTETIVIKEKAVLLNIGGVRCIITSNECMVFEPEDSTTVKFLNVITPRLKATAKQQHLQEINGNLAPYQSYGSDSHRRDDGQAFELDVLEAALIVATGSLDAELVALMQRARSCLSRLPTQINPINLEELRRTKQSSVDLESKAQSLVELLEEILDDDQELAEINLSSQPLREARQRRRERNRLRREQFASGNMSNMQDAQDALAQLEDDENEEEDIEKVEDLLEFYLQRVSATQNQAERVLAGARDLEESIGVSLSARRFEVNRLELLLSMGSFASCLGAVIAGIFGMNMRNTMELSVLGFYGVTAGIILLCVFVFITLLRYTKHKNIV